MITIPTKYLKAALLAAAKKDIRTYMNAVLLELLPDETRCVATTGSIAAVFRHPHQSDQPAPPVGEIIVPRAVVEMAVKDKIAISIFERDGATPGDWIINRRYRFTPMDYKFPDYRRIFPASVSGDAGMFDPQLLAEFGKMATALGVPTLNVTLHQNGESTACVSIADVPEFAGLISPLNLKAKSAPVRLGVAQWVRG